jgi:lysophospholipase L1-like esterase
MSEYKKLQNIMSLLSNVNNFIIITVVFLIIGHYFLGFGFWALSSLTVDPMAVSPVYSDYPDRKEFWKEQRKLTTTSFEPYFHWKQNEYVGKYINIDAHGIRKTVKNPNAKGGKKVFMFGGSTLWGQGSPDESTIPSILQSHLGDMYDVYNYGEDGYVATQELNYLLYQLAFGNIPDVVIFYDGVNNGYAGAYSPAIPRDPQNIRTGSSSTKNIFMRLIIESNYNKLAMYVARRIRGGNSGSDAWDKKIQPMININAKKTVNMYEAHIRQVKALAKAYNFRVFFFWQPHLLSLTKKKVTYEENIIRETPEIMVEALRQVYLEANEKFSNREEENIFFIGNVFDDVERPLYFDWCHVGPEGNRLIVDKMISLISAKI